MAAQAQPEPVNNANEPIARPQLVELVTKQILYMTGLNAQAFSGAQNPSTIYRLMVDGSPSVFPYYRETEEKDTAIAAALATRRLLVLARAAKVQSADAESGEAQSYAQGLSEMFDSIPRLDFAMWELLDAPAYGYAVAEILWAVGGPLGVFVKKLIGRPQETFRFGRLTEPQIGELLLADFPGGEGRPVPPAKFLVASYQPRHGDRRGLPLLRRLFWPSWFKRNALRLMLKYLEKGDGTVVVKYPSGASDDDKTKALAAAVAIATEIASAVPEGFSLMEGSGLTTQRARTGSDFKDMFAYWDDEMTRIILGQTQTTRAGEDGKGTQALGRVHENIGWQVVKSDAADLEDVFNEQLAAPWLAFRYGPRALERDVRPYWRIDKEPPRDVTAALDQIARARNAGMQIAAQWAHEKAQIPIPEEGEETLPPPALSLAMLGPEEQPLPAGDEE